MTNLRETILAADKQGLVPVQIEGWPLLYVRPLSALARDQIEVSAAEARRQGRSPNFRGQLLAACVCDEQGQGTGLSADDWAQTRHSEPLVDAALRINGMAPEAREAAEKN